MTHLCNEALIGFCEVDRCRQVHIELLASVVQHVCPELLQPPHALVYLYAPACSWQACVHDLPRQQAGCLGGQATSHQASKGGWVDKVVAMLQTQAVDYDYTATFSTQWCLSEVTRS